MLETVLPLSLSLRLGISSGSNCKLATANFMIYVTMTGINGSPGYLIIDLGKAGLWSLRLG